MMDFNFWIVLLAAVVGFAVGMIWYSKAFFGKAWMNLVGISESEMDSRMKKSMGKSMLSGFIGQLVTAYVLAYFIKSMGATGFTGGVTVAFWVWLGFLATTMLGAVIWEGRPMKLYYINVFHSLVGLALMGGILSSMM